jgi:hypothetical protein
MESWADGNGVDLASTLARWRGAARALMPASLVPTCTTLTPSLGCRGQEPYAKIVFHVGGEQNEKLVLPGSALEKNPDV